MQVAENKTDFDHKFKRVFSNAYIEKLPLFVKPSPKA